MPPSYRKRLRRLPVRAVVLLLAGLSATAYVLWQIQQNRDPATLAKRLGEEARILIELGDLSAAEERFSRARELQPGEPQWLVDLAQVHITRGQLTAAEELLRADLARSGDLSVRIALAKLLLFTRRPRPARALMEEVLEAVAASPEWKGRSETLRVAGLANAGCGDLARGRALLKEATGVGGRADRVAAFLDLTRVHLAFWQLAEAEATLRKAKELAPESAEVALAQVALLQVSGESVQAERELRQLYGSEDRSRRLVGRPLAELLVARGQLDEARELASELAAFDEASAAQVRVLIGLRQGDQAATDAEAKRLTELMPESPDAHMTRAQVALRGGDLAQARASYEATLRVAPGQAQAELGLLSLDLRAREFAAVQERGKALLADPVTRAGAVCALLTAARAVGKIQGVIERLQELRRRFPDDGSIRAYALIFRLLGDAPPPADELARLAADRQLPGDLLRLASAETGSSEAVEAIELLGEIAQKEPRLGAVRLVLAQIYEGLGRRDLALREVDAALSSAPTVHAHQYRARLALASGDLAEAKRQLQACLALQPSDTVLALLAELELQLGETAAAVELLRELSLRRSDHAAFQAAYGRALVRAGKTAEALEAFAVARKAQPKSFSSHQEGALRLVQGELEPARQAFALAWQQTHDPRFAAALAATHALSGDAERGLDLLGEWRASAPDAPEGLVAQATLRGLSHQPGSKSPPPPAVPVEVLAPLAQLPQSQPPASPPPPNRKIELEAFALWVLGWRAEARERVSQALPGVEVDPPLLWWAIRMLGSSGDVGLRLSLGRQLNDLVRAEPWVGLGLVQLQEASGDRDAALATLRDLRARFPQDRNVTLRLGQVLERSGAKAEALALYVEVGDVPTALNNWAYLRGIDSEHRAEAIDAALKAVGKAPGRGEYRDTLGWLLFLDGRHEESLEHLSRAAILLPTQPSVRYHLGLALRALGRTERARNNLKMALLLGEFPERADAEAALRALDEGRRE